MYIQKCAIYKDLSINNDRGNSTHKVKLFLNFALVIFTYMLELFLYFALDICTCALGYWDLKAFYRIFALL